MCLIIAARTKKPSLEILKKAESANGDGAGVVWINENKKAQWKKGLNADGVFKVIEDLPLPFVIHFRLGSRGLKKDLLLTHPFVIAPNSPLSLEGEADKLFVHNGTIFDSDWKWGLLGAGLEAPDDLMSDSRAIAMILSQHKNYDFLKKIKGNFIYIDSTKEKFPFVILGDTFKYEDGMYFSNFEWKYRTNYVGSYASDYGDMGYVGQCKNYQNTVGSNISNIPNGTNNDTKKKSENLLNQQSNSSSEILLDRLLKEYIVCQECREVISNDRIRELFKQGHDSGDTMKCLPCAQGDSYFHKNSTERIISDVIGIS